MALIILILILGVVLYLVLQRTSKDQLPIGNNFNDAELVGEHQKKKYSEIGLYQSEKLSFQITRSWL